MAASTSHEQWIQLYDQQFSDSSHHLLQHHIESQIIPLSSSSSSLNMSPKGGSVLKRLTKKRSRASKRSHTTHLNANTSNFRALVQQFTGRPSSPMSFFGVSHIKGPITLNFQRGRREMQIHHNTVITSSTRRSCNDNNNQVLHLHRHLHQQKQQQELVLPEKEYDDDDDNDCMVMERGSGFSSPSAMDVSDHDQTVFKGLMDGDDFSLDDLIAMNNAFSNDIGYFM